MLRVVTNSEQLFDTTPLIKGIDMWCPNCKRLHDVLAYIPLQRRKACSHQTVNIYKCPNCGYLFAPLIDLRDFT